MLPKAEFKGSKHHGREPVRLLLLEDDPQFAELLRAQLRRMPWVESRLEVVGTLADAVARLASESFGLVLADLNLPDSSGLGTVEALTRAGEQPVIVLTGDQNPALRAGAMECGAYDFLSKDNLSAAALEQLVRLAAIQASTYRSLRESETRFRSLVHLSSDFYWESDPAHRVVKIEHGSRNHPAVNPSQLGKARWETPSTNPGAEGWAAHRATMEAHQPFHDFEIARCDDDGIERWRSISGEPLFDEGGVFKGYRGIGKDITERKRAEEELLRFRLALDNSADMVVLIDRASMRFVDVNTTACKLLGYSREEMLAMGPQDVLPASREQLQKTYDELIRDPSKPSGMKSHYRCKDGSLLPFESTRRVLRSGSTWLIAAISRDIRERTATEAALRESEARFRSLTGLSSDWYWEQDAEFRTTYVSTEFSGKTGVEGTARLGRRRWEMDFTPLSCTWEEHRAQLEAHKPFRDFEYMRVGKDGERLYFSLSGEPMFDAPGRFTGYRGIGRDITQAKRTEQAMRESEARFRSLNALSSDWYWETDAEHRFVNTPPRVTELTGFKATTYVGKCRWEVPGLLPVSGDWKAHREVLERRESYRDLELVQLKPDGTQVYLQVSGEPVYEADGSFKGYRGTAKDISERKRSERAVLQLGRMYAALGAANEAILRAKSQQEVFERVCGIAVEAGGFLIGTVFVLKAQTKTLSRAAASGVAASLVEQVVPSMDESQPAGKGLIGHACRTGERAISNDYAADARTDGRRSLVRSYQIGSAAVFPLFVEGELVGVFGLQHAERGAFSEELTGLLQRLADNISFALESFHRDTRRRRAKRKLGESEQRFRSMTVLSSDMYWEQDADYRFTTFSGAPEDKIRLGRDSMIGKRRWEQHYFNMSEAGWTAHRAALDARQPFHDLELGRVNAAGEKVWVSVSGEPVFDDGGAFKGYRGVAKDISKRKREEVLLRLEHAVTRRLADAESSSSALREVIRTVSESEGWECGRYFAADEKAQLLRFSEAWGVATPAVEEFLSRSRKLVYRAGQGLTGSVWQTGEPTWVSDVSKDPRSSGSSRSSSAKNSLQGGAFVFPVIAEGKTIGVLSFSTRSVRPPEERMLQAVHVIGSQVGQFLQRKKGEEVLRESEARFRSLTSLSSDWYWEQNAEFRFTKFEGRGSGGDYAPAAAVLGKRVWELDGLVRESFDLDAHRARLERHEAFRDLEYEYRDRSGTRFYIRVDGEPVLDPEGRFAGYRGTSRDVTQQRRGEEELRRFRAAMDMSHDAIYLTDRATMRFLDVNKVGCKWLGYTREQLLAKGPHEVLGASREQLEGEYDAVIAEGSKAVRVETSYVTKDGRRGWTELHRRALNSADGWIIVSISRDITERKRAEERQAAHLRYQERIARFGQSALAKREPAELIDEAVQTLLEALGADGVAYVEPGPGERELVLRALVGVADAAADSGTIACPPDDPVLQVLHSGERKVSDGASLQLPWAARLRSAGLFPVRGEQAARGALCVFYQRPDAFGAEALNFAEAAASVMSTGLQRIDSESRLAYLAQFDALTGLPNRALLADRFSQMIVQARRHGAQLGVLFIDLDEFKLVNDTLGHAGGDALLKEAAVRLQSAVRQGDTVARISGDEFAIVLADLKQPEDAALVAQKVIDRLAATVEIGGQEIFVTASVGIAVFPGDGGDAETLIGAADAAMYRAKQSGRNAYQFFTADINQRLRARAQMGIDLRRALEREEFTLAYQPKYNLETRRPKGAEALLRWKHPERGPVSPVEFIPVLEETGLIVQVGEWVLRRACEDLKAWQAAGIEVGPVAVNLSARQFRQQDLGRRIKEIVAAAGVAPALLELEITESHVMQDPDHAVQTLRSLCEAGMRIAIDDFGTGYSSLSYLTRFPPGSLKIDRSFVKNMFGDKGDGSIVRIIIEMAHTLGFTVIAEGVETEEQANLLRLLRCELAQGFLFARPMPAAELAELFRTSAKR